jgi:hypothetical protein
MARGRRRNEIGFGGNSYLSAKRSFTLRWIKVCGGEKISGGVWNTPI